MRKSLAVCALVGLTAFVPCAAQDRPAGWADAVTAISVEDFLQMYFQLSMGAPETSTAFNSFNLITFIASDSQDHAFLLITQTYNDPPLTQQDKRREIRKVADSVAANFVARSRLPIVAKRWHMTHPQSSIIIRHVRASDVKETLGITVDGATRFDDEAIKAAKHLVESRGAAWAWQGD